MTDRIQVTLQPNESVRITREPNGSVKVEREPRKSYGATWVEADKLQQGKRRWR